MTIEELKDKALQLILAYCRGGRMSEQEKIEFVTEYKNLACRYQIGDEVWYLDDMKIIRCRVVGRGFNSSDNRIYRLGEDTGRFVGGNIPECLLFSSKEEIVAALQEEIAESR